MRLRPKILTAAALLLMTAVWGFAQDDNTPRSAVVPNPMGLHTWFIIAAIGAFLAWSISYSLQLQKEALKRRNSRDVLLRRKNQYLDEIAELDAQKTAGTISEGSYRRRFNNTRIRLGRVLEEIEENRETSQ